MFRLLPGSLERPTARVNEHILLASVIDRVLVPQFGFGLFDAGELVLRRLDHVARSLAPHWPDGPVAEATDDPRITRDEIDAAAELLCLDEMLCECTHPDRAAAAAARYTVPAKELHCDPSHPVSTFWTVIATRVRGAVVPLPAGFLIEAVPAIGTELAAAAFEVDPNVEDVFAGSVGNRVGRLFQGSGHSIAGPIRAGSGGRIHSLITFNGRQILALDIAAGLTPAAIQVRLGEGARTLARIRPGVEVQTPAGTWRLPADAQVARVQVIAGPHQAIPLGTSSPMMELEDLEWIVYSAQRSREDLWYFVRDLENSQGTQRTFAWDL